MSANRAPLIGLTTYPPDEENRYVLPRAYVDSVRRAGGVPLLVTPGEQQLDQLLDTLDGIVFIGGGDIDPGRYGEQPHPTIYNLNEERDSLELALARWVFERRLPALGICRGMQIFTVALGGSLNVHVPDVHGEEIKHRVPPRDPVAHTHTLEQASNLLSIMGEQEFSAQSWHHQSVKSAPDGFKIVARAPDGCAEAMEHPDRPELMCVQWHPEITADVDATQQRLFDELIRLSSSPS